MAVVNNDILTIVSNLILSQGAIWVHGVAAGAQISSMQLPVLRLVNLAGPDHPVVPTVLKLLVLRECAQVLLIRVRESLDAALNIRVHAVSGEDLIVVQMEGRVVHDCDQGFVLRDLVVHAGCGQGGAVAVDQRCSITLVHVSLRLGSADDEKRSNEFREHHFSIYY